MTDLWPHQEKAIYAHGHIPKFAFFFAPRCGKTRTTIEWLGTLPPQRTLVCAPLAVCAMWADQLEAAGQTVVRGYAQPVKALGAALQALRGPVTLVLNYDKAARSERLLLAWKAQTIVCDESHYLKAPQSGRGKALRKLCWAAPRVRLLTGTPAPNSFADLWGQLSCLNKDKYGTWAQYRYQYLICDSVFPSRILGHRNEVDLQTKMLPDVMFVRREDVFGPDSYQVVERQVPLPKKARAMYDTLVSQWMTDAPEVRADHVLKRMIRLQQITAGFCPDEQGKKHDIHDAKVEAVMADLEGIVASGEKAVIFHKFRWESERYYQEAQKLGCIVLKMNGDSSIAEREEAVRVMRESKSPVVLVAQIQTAGIGISLAEATHALFVSQSFSFTDEEQARDRIYKQGQNRCLTYYRCPDTVDDFIADIIKTKGDVHSVVTHADVASMAYGNLRKQKYSSKTKRLKTAEVGLFA
jgi:hypothetical protein